MINKRSLYAAALILFTTLVLPGAQIRRFTVSPTTISFPDLNPDLSTEIQSNVNLQMDFSIRKIRDYEAWSLTMRAQGDLISGPNSIPISNIRWEVSLVYGDPPPQSLENGIFSPGVSLPVASGEGGGGPNDRRADVTLNFQFFLQNLWAYAPGTYFQTVTVTLNGPGDIETRTFTFSYTVQPRSTIELATLTVNFPDANPDLVASIPAQQNPVEITVKTRCNGGEINALSCLSTGDLSSGVNTIVIGAISWTSSGVGYIPGVMSRITPQKVGSWTGPGLRSGSASFFLANSWSYNTGSYTATVVYTLSSL